MEKMPIIEIVESGKQEAVTKKGCKYSLRIIPWSKYLPKDVERAVSREWNRALRKESEIAKDVLTAFFISSDKKTNTDFIHLDNFRYVQAFSKSPDFIKHSSFADKNNLVPLSSLCLVITSDGKIIFGVKKNMSHKISGFSGYAGSGDIKGNKIDLYKYLCRKIKEELNIPPKSIKRITRIGKTYSGKIVDDEGRINTKSYDNNFLILLNIDSGRVSSLFRENFQFSKLVFCDDLPHELVKFVENKLDSISAHCVGAIYNYLLLKHKGEAKKLIRNLPKGYISSQKIQSG
ncbi:hypothetical protein CO038_02820 [Candidatus Pacearchaeota archaeon CG_4_9_14_0_2_um_filter_39_13]|nr:hypothetical protein [Candidatus Pacearchaeota archaeon]OIO42863.1 MAG: hypothetical protein AUJ64_03435 [Candidatus Pacearchaeota archaeon CG1_02_39_14]PJC44620.1 MAG: hypothetical protein CO038_02820 [Candidatus Pacearchaeota archaeon CG_4_9_14_0_2_um_filter_39_13]